MILIHSLHIEHNAGQFVGLRGFTIRISRCERKSSSSTEYFLESSIEQNLSSVATKPPRLKSASYLNTIAHAAIRIDWQTFTCWAQSRRRRRPADQDVMPAVEWVAPRARPCAIASQSPLWGLRSLRPEAERDEWVSYVLQPPTIELPGIRIPANDTHEREHCIRQSVGGINQCSIL